MISTGASVKAVQRALGHATAAMTLDRYAGLFEEDLEALADRLEDRFAGLPLMSSSDQGGFMIWLRPDKGPALQDRFTRGMSDGTSQFESS